MKTVAVLGTGTMGPATAASFAAVGYPVMLWGRRSEARSSALERARAAVSDLVRHGLAVADQSAAISATGDLAEAVGPAAVVIEAISEDVGVKRELFTRMERHADRDTLLTSTTSGLVVDDFAAAVDHPDRVLALHFWNPAHLMPIVEVAGGTRTSAASMDAGCALVERIGKRPVRLRRSVPGFIGTRLQQAVVREAIALLAAGVADAADIDAATRLSFGARFPVLGPLETSDLGGLDVVAAIHAYLLADLDASGEPHPALRERVDRGDLGVKTGRGFYDWQDRDASALVSARDAELVARVRALRAAGQLADPTEEGAAG